MTVTFESRRNYISSLVDARNHMRADSVIEQLVLERTTEFPEDTFHDFARESFQYGAGHAYAAPDELLHNEFFVRDESGDITIAPEIIRAFFDTLPRNRHQPPEKVAEYERTVARLVAQAYEGHAIRPLHPVIDMYQFEAFIAFIEGYRLVARHKLGQVALSPVASLRYSSE